jgi:hypothetical protein
LADNEKRNAEVAQYSHETAYSFHATAQPIHIFNDHGIKVIVARVVYHVSQRRPIVRRTGLNFILIDFITV